MIYDFQCEACGVISEEFMSYKDMDRPIRCEYCEDGVSRRMDKIYTPHVHVKGGHSSLYPMVNPTLVDKTIHKDKAGNVLGVTRKPVVWNTAAERKQYMKDNGLVEGITAKGDTWTQDSDFEDVRDKTTRADAEFDARRRRNPAATVQPTFVDVDENLEVKDVA